MRFRRAFLLLTTATAAALTGCGDPYEKREGEYYAGPVDPVNFPPEYLGSGGNRFRAGAGIFVASGVWANRRRTEYFAFSFTPSQLALPDKLLVLDDGQPNASTTIPAPIAYVFDPRDDTPFPETPRCEVPPNYIYDRQRDAIRFNEQWNVFTVLPSATYTPGIASTTTYVPVVSEVPVRSNGEPCQDTKSEKTLRSRADVTLPTQGAPDGRFLAWAIIDPGAGVYHRLGAPSTPGDARTGNPPGGVDLQKFGWFNHYLLAYLDGGYIPTQTDIATNPSRTVVRMVTQDLYYPRSLVIHVGPLGTAPGALGRGYDLLQFRRGEPGYAPVCRVLTYDTGDTRAPADLPRSVDELNALYGDTIAPPDQPPAPAAPIPLFIYCLQLE
ncbi:MAG TPA: hypothetical protein VKE49_13445 [Myxococcaceae bacterium]|nr:hypothetical protein [Myxococcaceae bacterium]